MRLNGIDAVLLNREEVQKRIPMADFSDNVRFPIFGGLMQPSAGTARHDAVAWGYARQADSMGVDIIQNCEVTGFDVTNGKIVGVRTSRGDIKAKKVGLCVAGSTNILAEMLNMTLPYQLKLIYFKHVYQNRLNLYLTMLLHLVQVTFIVVNQIKERWLWVETWTDIIVTLKEEIYQHFNTY